MKRHLMRHFWVGLFLLICTSDDGSAATTINGLANAFSNISGVTKGAIDLLEFNSYVATCKAELGFDSIPQMNCNDIQFRNKEGGPEFADSTDFVTHSKLTSEVDAVFACRWVHPNEGITIPGFINEGDMVAASGEMIVHNKASGKSCFFKMRPANTTQPIDGATADHYERIATTMPASPTEANAFQYWDSVRNVAVVDCTQCHAAGPWIASPQIVGALARFGLINDGHDIKHERYAAVGSLADLFNSHAQASVDRGALQNTCSTGCHVLAANDVAQDLLGFKGQIILPSITRVINDVIQGHFMAPDDPYNDYRWVNMDNPSGAGGDWERLKDLNAKRPQFACSRGVKEVQMQAVDSGRVIWSGDFPDVLRTFNLLDGLVCKNADQPNGHTCADYQTSYHCGSGLWTKWRNLSTPNSDGDDESRANFPSMCSSPWEIKAQVVVNGKVKYFGYGPPDRMQEFNTTTGVACRNSVQPSGQCQDYTVRYICAQ